MNKQVIVTIASNGELKIEAKGYKGEACLKATAFMRELFGDPSKTTLKPSYHAQEEKIIPGLPNGLCG